ncbi:MAG: small basic family protein [Armatimonadetes bacterium]|nr:small basic family protein [Armatimonadota bacterium]
MILIPILALLVGLLLGFMLKLQLGGIWQIYMAVAVVAGIDTVLGGIRSALEGKFRGDVFVTGFIANVAIASFLAWFGDKIGANVYFVAILVLGTRIFTNLSIIRRQLLTKWHDVRERKRLDSEAKAQQGESESKAQTVAT